MSDDSMEEVELIHPPSLDDIREWGRQNGYGDVPERGRLPRGLRDEFNEAHGIEGHTRAVDSVSPEQPPNVEVEKTPIQRAKGIINRRSKVPAKTSKKKPPKPRVSAENVISTLWGGLSLVMRPVSPAASRAFAMEAPVAGMLLDESVRGTVIDKVLQPFARVESSSKTLGALLMPPMIVATMERYPQMTERLLPLLRQSLAWHIQVAGPKMEELMKRQEDFEKQYGQTVDNMILMFFNGDEEASE